MSEFYFTGNDLIEMGIKPGPRFGVILKELNQELAANSKADDKTVQAALDAVIARHKAEIDAIEAERLARVIPLLSREEAVDVIYNIDAQGEDEEAATPVRTHLNRPSAC